MPRLHDDELNIDSALVRRLIADQFPKWASLPLRPLESSGTVNAIFRLGDDLSVRLPRASRFEERETDCWLDHLAERLPLPIPEPIAAGRPDEDYPLHWTIHRWLEGEPWRLAQVDDPVGAAAELADFVHALRGLDPSAPACPSLWDGGLFSASDAAVRAAAPRATGVDTKAVLRAWDSALLDAPFDGEPVLIHWDLLPGNVLVNRGRIAAVIDWGALAVGDPARDLVPAWTLFDGASRQRFKTAMGDSDDTWARARGWGLAFVVGVAYYAQTNPTFAAECRSTVSAVLGELER